jgi:hypothetical protein
MGGDSGIIHSEAKLLFSCEPGIIRYIYMFARSQWQGMHTIDTPIPKERNEKDGRDKGLKEVLNLARQIPLDMKVL